VSSAVLLGDSFVLYDNAFGVSEIFPIAPIVAFDKSLCIFAAPQANVEVSIKTRDNEWVQM
jgi:hypothetical protein